MRKTAKARKGAAPKATALRLQDFEGLASAFADLAAAASADEFCVFMVSPGLNQCRLLPAVDSEFPKTSRASKRLAAKVAENLGERLRSSTRPFLWRRDRRSGPLRLHLADEADPLGHEVSGFALPLHAASGRNGLVVFLGETPGLSDAMLIELQLRSVQLFSTLVDMTTASTRKVPAMSNRELDCLRLTADGKTSDEIAELLHLSAHTANQYLTAAAQKLNAVNRTHAVSKALRLGLIS